MPYPYYPYQPNYFQPPMPDQLAQLRQNQFQQMQQPQQLQPQVQAQPATVPASPAQTQLSGRIWVPSEQAALDYLVAPNCAVDLWDINRPVIYLKQADASGKPSMKTYDLVERTQRTAQSATEPPVEYAPLSRVEALEAKLSALEAIKEQPVKATPKKAVQKEDAE